MKYLEKNKESYKGEIHAAIIIVIVIILLWGISWYLIDRFVVSSDIKQISTEVVQGTFGDKFGAINALFSGLAFAGIIFTILLQRKELELQRNELEQTRDVFSEQGKTLKLQQFESTFFNLLNLHHQIVDAIDIQETNILGDLDKEPKMLKSRDCFKFFYDDFKKCYRAEEQLMKPSKNDTDELLIIEKAFHEFFIKYQSDLGHYWRNMYNILKFINKQNPEDKFFYSNLLRAQLSSHELLLLFYNCLSHYGNKKFKPLIEDHYFLQNLAKPALIEEKKQLNLYKSSAYSKPD